MKKQVRQVVNEQQHGRMIILDALTLLGTRCTRFQVNFLTFAGILRRELRGAMELEPLL